jgi:hypothetical protein
MSASSFNGYALMTKTTATSPPVLHSGETLRHLQRAEKLQAKVIQLEQSHALQRAEIDAMRLQREADVALSLYQISKLMDETLQRQIDELETDNRLSMPSDVTGSSN